MYINLKIKFIIIKLIYAPVAELVDALVSGINPEMVKGSSPFWCSFLFKKIS